MFVWMRQEAPPQEVGQVEERIEGLGFTSDPRGIRTFETMPLNAVGLNAVGLNAVGLNAVGLNAVGLNAVGLNAVVMFKELPHLPALVDASHGIGVAQGVRPMGKGAVGVMVEIHPDPDRVWSGGVLGLDSDLFQSVMKDRQRVAALVDRRL